MTCLQSPFLVQARDGSSTPSKLVTEDRTSSLLLLTGRGEVERRRQRQQVTLLSIELERLASQLAAERAKSEHVIRAKDTRILVVMEGLWRERVH